MDIGSRLDKAMTDARVESQSQLARLSGVPQATISRILKGQGKQGPETVTLDALAKALGVELRWLQQGLGPQRIGPQGQGAEGSPVEKPAMRIVEMPAEPKLQWVTEREAELLSDFRACAEVQRDRILGTARGLAKNAARSTASKKA